jgi:hypothetical protein
LKDGYFKWATIVEVIAIFQFLKQNCFAVLPIRAQKDME